MAELKYVDQTGLKTALGLLRTHLENNYRTIATSYSKDEVDNLISAINKFDVKVVASLPTASADTMYSIYLVSKGEGKTGYTEHITLRSGEEGAYTYTWEEIGDTEVDLSDYVKKTFTIAGIDMQDNITAEELTAQLPIATDEAKGLLSKEYKGVIDDNAENIDKFANLFTGDSAHTMSDEAAEEWFDIDSGEWVSGKKSLLQTVHDLEGKKYVAKIKDGTYDGGISFCYSDNDTAYYTAYVKGLKSAAFTESTDYDAVGAAATAEANANAYADGKFVEKVDGKSLSSNDLTDELKEAYDRAATDSHIHANFGELCLIEDGDVAKWNAKQDAIAENTYDVYGSASAVQGETTETVASVDAKIAALDTTAALSNDEVTAAFNEVFG